MALERTTNRTVRLRNRAALLSKLFLEGPLTRQDLARGTGLSQPAVSNVVADLIAAGLVVDAGALESDGGRPSMSLRVAPRFALVAGVDVGETRVRVELFDLSMALLASADYPIDAARPDPATVVHHIVAGLSAVTARAGVPGPSCSAWAWGCPASSSRTPTPSCTRRRSGGTACRWNG
ncbi:hypothetical protein Pflav_034870 [Phytohabitans flavus]|uniref:HTH marR-type domain-containing protein n=1 Tax=Phytohabitans flavus TaxID=1076124 RepID=A0A6F8XTF8_9ACTN|nr:winged helix-turn-helix domain-containing protein [Phytohabitans flavus]BCB77077.1 hypothetical protein Pflav_034870 [Phytohabitans flavus]